MAYSNTAINVELLLYVKSPLAIDRVRKSSERESGMLQTIVYKINLYYNIGILYYTSHILHLLSTIIHTYVRMRASDCLLQ